MHIRREMTLLLQVLAELIAYTAVALHALHFHQKLPVVIRGIYEYVQSSPMIHGKEKSLNDPAFPCQELRFVRDVDVSVDQSEAKAPQQLGWRVARRVSIFAPVLYWMRHWRWYLVFNSFGQAAKFLRATGGFLRSPPRQVTLLVILLTDTSA